MINPAGVLTPGLLLLEPDVVTGNSFASLLSQTVTATPAVVAGVGAVQSMGIRGVVINGVGAVQTAVGVVQPKPAVVSGLGIVQSPSVVVSVVTLWPLPIFGALPLL